MPAYVVWSAKSRATYLHPTLLQMQGAKFLFENLEIFAGNESF
jgi:hypothetical protein